MKRRWLFALAALFVLYGCGDQRQPTAPGKAPPDPSEIITDGAHGGNPDFFFLPPLVPLPLGNPDFEVGKFNNTLQPSLRIDICELKAENLNAEGRPTNATACVDGAPLKTFAPGTVQLVNLPLQQTGWWSLFNLPPDGFYYVLWNTEQSNLSLSKYYRIKVFIDGATTPLGIADVDPIRNLRQWQYSLTGEVIQLVDDSWLAIPFRVEQNALCGGATQCTSGTLTNDNPNGDSQILRVLNEDGVPVAGVLVPDGWLPADGPQSVVFTISRVNTGLNDVAAGTQQFPCHANLPLQQFDGCFNFSTIPELQPIDETGRQFATSIIGAVCFVLIDTEDPREPWVQLWSSEPDVEGDQPIPLRSADASQILTDPAGRNCGTPEVIADNSSGALSRFASAGWRTLTKGLGRAFGVKTAYAVDLGLGGILDGISNIGPALSAEIQAYTSTTLTLGGGSTTTSTARIVGTQIHQGGPRSTGIGGVQVTFSLAPGHGSLNILGTTGGAATQLTVTTNTNPIDGSPVSGGGFAPINWTMPTVPGTYTLTASSAAIGGSVTFTATVSGTLPDLVISTGTPTVTPATVSSSGGTVQLSPWTLTNQGGAFVLTGLIDNGFYISTDAVITTSDTYLDGNFNSTEVQGAGASFNWGGPTLQVPALSPGTYYIGLIIDRTNVVAESNETNNYVSTPLQVVAPVIDGVLSAGEWNGASTYSFTANVPGGGTTPATFYVKNDAQNLYLAVRFARTVVDAGDNRWGFEFDTNNDGLGPASGDDYFGFQHTPISIFFDAFRSGGGASVTDDTVKDGAGAFANNGTHSVFEISHPLNSGQTGQDFALSPGSTIGVFFQLIIGDVTTTYPGPFIQYTPITISGP